jgi:hypothetical protein
MAFPALWEWLNDPRRQHVEPREHRNRSGERRKKPDKRDNDNVPQPSLGEWDAGDDDEPPPPRGWLLGNVFARRFVSSLYGDGGVGKTAVRYAQYLSLAAGRALTGEHVFQRCRVLVVSLEDDKEELSRRMFAARLHHGVSADDVGGWLFLAAPGKRIGKLLAQGQHGAVQGSMGEILEAAIIRRRPDLVALDPFKKTHAVSENDNTLIDIVIETLTDLAIKHDIAVDAPHHTAKGPPDPGNPNRGRGAGAGKDAGRLIYTLTAMSIEEAQGFGIDEAQRRSLVRMDSGKVNIAPPLHQAKWFRLVGVPLNNATALYPNGDNVQVAEPWTPPDLWQNTSVDLLNRILSDIDAGFPDGNRYSAAGSATERAAWKVITKHAPDKGEGQAREMVRNWLKNGVLVTELYDNPVTRKKVSGLRVDNTKRPGRTERFE